jgi:methionyl-tRNA formyltransferase
MGTSLFACPTLNALADAQDEVVGVFTQPDRRKGRGLKVRASPVKMVAMERGLPVFQPEKIGHNESVTLIQRLAPHIIVVAAYGQILPLRILDIPQHGCINVHGSLLPKYRGAAPINWALIKGENKTGVTTMLMSKGLDEGDILLQRSLVIDPYENAGDLHDRMAHLGAEVLMTTIGQWKNKAITPRRQQDSEATFAPSLRKEDGNLDWHKSAEALYNQVRGMNPWPVAHTLLDGKTLRVFRALMGPVQGVREPGTVINVSDEGIVVATGKGALVLREVQLQGRKRLPAAEFLRGKSIPPGIRLG